MTFQEKLRMALAKANMSEAAFARAMGTTPSALNQRIKTGKWKDEDYEKMAKAIGCKIETTFTFPDGTEI